MYKFFVLLLFLTPTAQAYYTTMDTADLVQEGHYTATASSQFITSGDSGANILGHFDGRLTEDSGYRAELGFGASSLQAAAYYKWAPIPDVGDQPGIALLGGISLASVEVNGKDFNDLSLRAIPIVSKSFQMDFGDLKPYASLPISFQNIDSETNLPIQLTLGSQLKTLHFDYVTFIGEVGFNIKDAFTYFSVGVVFDIDQNQGFQFR